MAYSPANFLNTDRVIGPHSDLQPNSMPRTATGITSFDPAAAFAHGLRKLSDLWERGSRNVSYSWEQGGKVCTISTGMQSEYGVDVFFRFHDPPSETKKLNGYTECYPKAAESK